MCGGLVSLDGDANFTRLNARLNLSIRNVQRSFYTYRKLFWPAPVARRCILEDRHVWRLAQFGWRCEFHSIECSVRRINTALSAKVLYIYIGIYASAGIRTIPP
jgi:G:T-mismatch repair DNA endonuclease (very short patch repair protein)